MNTIKGTLKHGLKTDKKVYKEFEMREATTQDMFDAEKDADVDTPLAFNGAMMCRQVIRMEGGPSPLSLQLLGKLKPVDYGILRQKQMELENMAEKQ